MRKVISNISESLSKLLLTRTQLLSELQELQADLEDLSDEDLVECREVMLKRVNDCLELIEESEEDNI